MQINGLREFTAKFTPALQSMGELNPNPPSNSLHGTDALNISEIGKRFRYSGAESVNRTLLHANSVDPIINLMENSVSSMNEILEKMHALALKAANDSKLSDLDRIDMQIEMEDLRVELKNVSIKMNKKLAEMSGYHVKGGEFVKFEAGAGAKSVLERARERINKGEQWDVAEEAGEDSVHVPTVREKLEKAGTVILMDAESAAKGVKRLEAEMEKSHAMKDEFIAFKSDTRRNRDANITELSSLRLEYTAMKEALRIKKEEEGSERGEDPDETEFILTAIGIMKTDENGNNPKLVRTSNPKGDMFAKLGRFFESAADSLSKTFIDESVYTADAVDTNVIWNTEAAEIPF